MSVKTKSTFYFKYITKTILYFFISAYFLGLIINRIVPGITTSPGSLGLIFYGLPISMVIFFVSMYIAYKVVTNEKKGLFFLVLDTAQYFLGFVIILQLLLSFFISSD